MSCTGKNEEILKEIQEKHKRASVITDLWRDLDSSEPDKIGDRRMVYADDPNQAIIRQRRELAAKSAPSSAGVTEISRKAAEEVFHEDNNYRFMERAELPVVVLLSVNDLAKIISATLAPLQAKIADFTEVLEDKRRLTAEIGRILDGENAAKQPSLCDLVGPIRKLQAELEQAKGKYHNAFALVKDDCETDSNLRDLLRPVLGKEGADHDGYSVVCLEDAVGVILSRLATAEQELEELRKLRTETLDRYLTNEQKNLQRENSELKEKMDRMRVVAGMNVPTYPDHVVIDLRSRLATAEADTRRLDWLDQERALLSWILGSGVEVVQWGFQKGGVVYRGQDPIGDRARTKGENIRAAIDAAQAKEKA